MSVIVLVKHNLMFSISAQKSHRGRNSQGLTLFCATMKLQLSFTIRNYSINSNSLNSTIRNKNWKKQQT